MPVAFPLPADTYLISIGEMEQFMEAAAGVGLLGRAGNKQVIENRGRLKRRKPQKRGFHARNTHTGFLQFLGSYKIWYPGPAFTGWPRAPYLFPER